MKRHFARFATCCAATLFSVNPGPVSASGIGQVISKVPELPPETQIEMLRILFRDLFGSRAELKAQFVQACEDRKKTPQAKPPATPAAAASPVQASASEPAKSLSKEATLALFCLPATRRQIEAALMPPKRAASAPDASTSSPWTTPTAASQPPLTQQEAAKH